MIKKAGYQRRFYRDYAAAKDLYSARVVFWETDIHILADKPLDKQFLRERIRILRSQIEQYIFRDKRFLTSLKPISIELNAPLIVKKMAKAAKEADVGPMAAVAGAMAYFLGRELMRKGFKEIIIENGGDIFMKTRKLRRVGIYSGPSGRFRNLCLLIKPKQTPIGICTSSGTVGHSLSFGCADSVIVLSKDPLLADAVATAAANRVKSAADLPAAIELSKSVKKVCSAVIIMGEKLISWGKIEFSKCSLRE